MKDIREYKKNLRLKYRQYRTQLTPEEKQALDEGVLARILRLTQYQRAGLVLTYVSTDIEVDTRRLIQQALNDGKRVAVPRCVPGTRNMEFYEIFSTDDLSPGTFGVYEPTPDPERLIAHDCGGICFVPGFCFDRAGFRLGYGKGYYDRFLSDYNGVKAGICYAACIRGSLFHGRYDCSVDLVITEQFTRKAVISHKNSKLQKK